MTTYKGQRLFQLIDEDEELCREIVVTADDQPLDPRLDILNKSASGFEWGYNGSGAAQLAFAILMNELKVEAFAVMLYQDFKSACIAPLKRDEWTITTQQIQEFLGERLAVKIIVPNESYLDEVRDLCDAHSAEYQTDLVDESDVNHHDSFIVYTLAEPALLADLGRVYGPSFVLSCERSGL